MSSYYFNPPSQTRSEKADRLVHNHRVILLGLGKAVVIGDHDTYDLVRINAQWRCSCPWGQRKGQWSDCSHILALRRSLITPGNQAPVARLADLLNIALNTFPGSEIA